MTLLPNLLTSAALTHLVESLVKKEKMTYIEAVIHVCDERGIDPADIARLITPPIKAKLESEGMASNLLPKTNTLDSFL
jgi:hypothetical protein